MCEGIIMNKDNKENEKTAKDLSVKSSSLLSVIFDKLEERQETIQDAYNENRSLAGEIRAMILLDLTIVMREIMYEIEDR